MNLQQDLEKTALTSLGLLPLEAQLAVLEQLAFDVQLKIVQGFLDKLSPEQIRQIISQFPPKPISCLKLLDLTPRQGGQFVEVYSGTYSMLEVGSTKLGPEVRLTLNATTIEDVFNEINAISRQKYGRIAIQNLLYRDRGVSDIITTNTVITFIPVLNNSGMRVKYGTEAETSHEGLLNNYDLHFVDRPYLTAAAGAYRVAKGFKSDESNELTADEGDLFGGLVVRARDGSIGMDEEGWVGCFYDDNDYACDSVAVSGRTTSSNNGSDL
jgi:hypothetical protein